MLEREQYKEAAGLLRFLLQCQGMEQRNYDEWQALLNWLVSAFPGLQDGSLEDYEADLADHDEEEIARQHAQAKAAEDKEYAAKLLQTVTGKPLSEQTFLALDQLSYLDSPEVDEVLVQWLGRQKLHPLLQYRVLQTLRRRGKTGNVSFLRLGERVEIEVESVPLRPEDFPPSVHSILERVGSQTQIHDPTLFYFAQELWFQFVMAMYGTLDYRSMLAEEEATIDIWAAALHQMVSDTLPGGQDDEEIRTLYGITDHLRLRYEQAYRSMRQFASYGIK
ncbi:hypothetical protein [Paenibacillus aceti]|uniref:Uncharacterized protein n=1 Tax=Paenibacillus aceti TaxID=1820010 RepID=A0ABQ1VQY1_9BACL|nr:hypothetical protein [Paenibacillus aceti]GGF89405.1 hypothetical protein GCM10010913_08510 [Paenibacillus aceti]